MTRDKDSNCRALCDEVRTLIWSQKWSPGELLRRPIPFTLLGQVAVLGVYVRFDGGVSAVLGFFPVVVYVEVITATTGFWGVREEIAALAVQM